MHQSKLTLAVGLFLLISCNSANRGSGLTNDIRYEVSRMQEKHIPVDQVKCQLINDSFFVLTREGEPGVYFLAYEDRSSEIRIITIYNSGVWMDSKSMNVNFIDANNKMIEKGLCLDAIWDKDSLVSVHLLDQKSHSMVGAYAIDDISRIGEFDHYRLEKLYQKDTPQLSPVMGEDYE